MEMNARLQVEHPVTEAITGQDLVEWQLRVASGEPLPRRQDELSISGWAMEARLYAETPLTGFLPSTGPLERLRLPEAEVGVRVDAGVEEGGEVTPFYDPMIAKLIVHAPDRAHAAARLALAAASVQVWPVRTNAAFLARAARYPEFIGGQIDTGFIERHLDSLIPDEEPSTPVLACAASAILPTPVGAPWVDLAGFRINGAPHVQVSVAVDGKRHIVDGSFNVPAASRSEAMTVGAAAVVFHEGEAWTFGPSRVDAVAGGGASDEDVLSPMPGRIIAIDVEVGQAVTKGQRLLIVEAMKMEHSLTAPFDGVVALLSVLVGDQVAESAVVARIEEGKGRCDQLQ